MGDRKLERQLLGYLVGALDKREEDRVRRRLARDPGLSAALTRLEESLEPLRTVTRTHEPPPGLAARTCQKVFAYTQAMAAKKSDASATRRPVRERARAMSPAAVPPVATAAWSWSDMVVAVGVFLAIAGSLFPAIHRSRVNMRLMACQNSLREFGVLHAHLDDAFPGTMVHPAVVNPWMAVDAPIESRVKPPALALERSSSPLSLPSFSDPGPHANQPRQLAQPVSTWSPVGRSADAACSMPHPGLRQTVAGQNLLLPDGQVSFVVVGPVIPPEAPGAGVAGPFAPTFVPGNLNPGDGEAGLAPIVLVSSHGQ